MATQAELDKLNAAINQGVQTVQYSDRRVTYRSLDEMMRIRDDMKAELGQTVTTRRYATTSKGL